MFEDMNYDTIMQRMLDRIPDDMDKREGSVIWDALSPAALELELAYIHLEEVMNEAFADTQSREYLIRRCAERSITPQPASAAVLQGEFTPASIDVINKRFNLNRLNFIVTEAIDANAGMYKVRCETPGLEGSQRLGDLIPIEYVDGLETARVTAVLIPGENEESTEALRSRYLNSFDIKGYGGNVQDYINKVNALSGVGATKVTPVWNGGGTVKLTILDSSYDKASSALIDAVQEAVDPTPQGEGWGIAPIGHTVTVETANEVTINVTATIEFDTGYSWGNLSTQITDAITAYLLELREMWADQENLVVRVAQIETRLLALTGIVDISGTTINDVAGNKALESNEIPVIGVVSDGA